MQELGEEVTVTAARNRIGELATGAYKDGRTFVITINGFPAAALVPLEVARRGQARREQPGSADG